MPFWFYRCSRGLHPTIAKDPTRKWTGKEKQQYIKDEFNIEVAQAGIVYRLKRF